MDNFSSKGWVLIKISALLSATIKLQLLKTSPKLTQNAEIFYIQEKVEVATGVIKMRHLSVTSVLLP